MSGVEELVKTWQEWIDRRSSDTFVLNPKRKEVERLARGVLSNEKKHGLKYCPCRMTTGDWEQDIKLICPCNFKVQKTWKEKGECWCSLFVKG